MELAIERSARWLSDSAACHTHARAGDATTWPDARRAAPPARDRVPVARHGLWLVAPLISALWAWHEVLAVARVEANQRKD